MCQQSMAHECKTAQIAATYSVCWQVVVVVCRQCTNREWSVLCCCCSCGCASVPGTRDAAMHQLLW